MIMLEEHPTTMEIVEEEELLEAITVTHSLS